MKKLYITIILLSISVIFQGFTNLSLQKEKVTRIENEQTVMDMFLKICPTGWTVTLASENSQEGLFYCNNADKSHLPKFITDFDWNHEYSYTYQPTQK